MPKIEHGEHGISHYVADSGPAPSSESKKPPEAPINQRPVFIPGLRRNVLDKEPKKPPENPSINTEAPGPEVAR
ncbi:hypothetical protein A3F29_04335 [Candidatus Roizmanbacteria bacterium RIFCSPHIGHO2_12_FULL_33_9]|uniref:Uncharacterized protein n=1 Tax=Candidatus Roizmanbacteria bacterium RIFCSPHIGHO2_12_FULL_33_9 TaxID=1802045 RepID=A0A1F7HIP9_9BACT|nr:MAG: hypothetical protein A3F29_04335 [Candidatus Roizmanbacteria bacterium RIFCSPHIGHO2_12_FULL_33_9]